MFELVFHPLADVEIAELPHALQGKVLAKLDKLEKQGNQLRYPHTRPIQDGLFELRAGNANITRTLFAYAKGKRIYILRTFVKKTDKTPLPEIKLAFSRLEELIDGN